MELRIAAMKAAVVGKDRQVFKDPRKKGQPLIVGNLNAAVPEAAGVGCSRKRIAGIVVSQSNRFRRHTGHRGVEVPEVEQERPNREHTRWLEILLETDAVVVSMFRTE